MLTENSVGSENAEVIIREIMVASTMTSVLIAFSLWSPPVFGPVPACTRRFSPFVTNWPFSTRKHRVAFASSPTTDSCGFCCRDSGRVGARACRWSSPTRSSGRAQELSPVLDQEIAATPRKTGRGGRDLRPHSAHEPSKPPVGCTPHSRGTAQVGIAVAQSTVARYLPPPGNRLPRPRELS